MHPYGAVYRRQPSRLLQVNVIAPFAVPQHDSIKFRELNAPPAIKGCLIDWRVTTTVRHVRPTVQQRCQIIVKLPFSLGSGSHVNLLLEYDSRARGPKIAHKLGVALWCCVDFKSPVFGHRFTFYCLCNESSTPGPPHCVSGRVV